MSKEYKMKGYYHFTITEPKTRDIFATHYIDRIVIRTLCDHVIQPIIGPKLIYENAACQTGKGTHFAINRMTKFLREHYKMHGNEGYALKCDIHKYFASINHEVLKMKLGEIIKDKEVLSLMHHYLDMYETSKDSLTGIPLGNQSSQWYGIYYMDCLDKKMKQDFGIKHYIRYMDDFILVHHDKAYLRECMRFIEEYVQEELKLTLNNKTQIFPLKKGFEFLGWKFYLTDTGRVVRKVKVQSKLRVKRNFRALAKEFNEGVVDFTHVKQVVMSYRGHMEHGHAYRLRQYLFQNLYYDICQDGNCRCTKEEIRWLQQMCK